MGDAFSVPFILSWDNQIILLMEFEIVGFEIWNTAQRIRNPSNHWTPESGIQCGIGSVEFRIYGCVPLVWSRSESVIRDQSDHGRSNELMNPCPEWIHRFIWSSMIRVISDYWFWSGSSQRDALFKRLSWIPLHGVKCNIRWNTTSWLCTFDLSFHLTANGVIWQFGRAVSVYTININTKVLARKPICTGWLIGLHDPTKDTAEAILEGLELTGIEEVNTAGIKVEAGSLSRFEAVDV